MNCPHCGHDNPEEGSHCHLCGDELTTSLTSDDVVMLPLKLFFVQFLVITFLIYYGTGLTYYFFFLFDLPNSSYGLFVLPPMMMIIGLRNSLRLNKGDNFARYIVLIILILFIATTAFMGSGYLEIGSQLLPSINLGWITVCVFSIYILLWDKEVIGYYRTQKSM